MKGDRTMRKFPSTLAAMAVLTPGLAWAAETVTIATVGPMSGQLATYGAQMKRGADLAVADLNAVGGVLGRQVTLEVQDDACDPKQAVAVANQVAIDRVALVAGHFCSGSSIPASGVYAEEHVLMITPSSTSPTLTDDAAAKGWRNILRANGRDDQQGEVAGAFLVENYADKRQDRDSLFRRRCRNRRAPPVCRDY
jgi:branched-chain amino acid transport system substrate-binding protein